MKKLLLCIAAVAAALTTHAAAYTQMSNVGDFTDYSSLDGKYVRMSQFADGNRFLYVNSSNVPGSGPITDELFQSSFWLCTANEDGTAVTLKNASTGKWLAAGPGNSTNWALTETETSAGKFQFQSSEDSSTDGIRIGATHNTSGRALERAEQNVGKYIHCNYGSNTNAFQRAVGFNFPHNMSQWQVFVYEGSAPWDDTAQFTDEFNAHKQALLDNTTAAALADYETMAAALDAVTLGDDELNSQGVLAAKLRLDNAYIATTIDALDGQNIKIANGDPAFADDLYYINAETDGNLTLANRVLPSSIWTVAKGAGENAITLKNYGRYPDVYAANLQSAASPIEYTLQVKDNTLAQFELKMNVSGYNLLGSNEGGNHTLRAFIGHVTSAWKISYVAQDDEAEILSSYGPYKIATTFPEEFGEDEMAYWTTKVLDGTVYTTAENHITADMTFGQKAEILKAETTVKRYLAQELDGKLLVFERSTDRQYICIVNNGLQHSATAPGSNSIWTAEYNAEEDGVTLKCGDKYIGRVPNTANGGHYGLANDVATAGCFRLYKYNGKYCIVATRYENGSATSGYEFGAGNQTGHKCDNWMQANNGIARWGSNPGTSQFYFAEIAPITEENTSEEAMTCEFGMNESGDSHVFTFTHPQGLSCHHYLAYDENLKIVVENVPTPTPEPEPEAEAAPRRRILENGGDRQEYTHNDLQVTDENVTLTIPSRLAEGNYKITVPAGMFRLSDGTVSAPIEEYYAVAADGTTTAIVELTAPAAQAAAIYDLQGRVVKTAAKGLYIINGKKTLVR